MKKKVFFLLRGLTRDQRHWGQFALDVEKTLDGFEVVHIDLPGFGTQNHMRSPLGVEKIADCVLNTKVFESYKDYEKKYIMGMSLGGMVTMVLVSKLTSYFDGVVVLNSSQNYKTQFFHRLNVKVALGFFKSFMFSSVRSREKAIYRQSINSNKNPKVIEDWVRFYNEKPFTRQSFLKQTLSASRFSIKKHLPQLSRQRGLVLCSKRDRLVSYESSRVISSVTGWPLIEHEWAGHDITFDDSKWMCHKLFEFICKN